MLLYEIIASLLITAMLSTTCVQELLRLSQEAKNIENSYWAYYLLEEAAFAWHAGHTAWLDFEWKSRVSYILPQGLGDAQCESHDCLFTVSYRQSVRAPPIIYQSRAKASFV
jgi:hypothetical protein